MPFQIPHPRLRALGIIVVLLVTGALHGLGQVPQLINYQGRVVVGSTNFNGSGQFKFALVNTNGSTTYWSNDGTSVAGSQPTAAVTLNVIQGLYSLQLGDTTVTNMTPIPNSVFSNSDVRLRIWFNDGTNGFQLLTPDQRIAAVGYAMIAGNVANGAITSAQIANGAVGSAQIANGAIGTAQLAPGLNLGGPLNSVTPGTGVSTALANAANTSGGVAVIGTSPLIFYTGFNGATPNEAPQSEVSNDGHTFTYSQTLYPTQPTGNGVRDPSILCQPNDPQRKPLLVNGCYWMAYTTGNFGECSYFGLAKSSDLKTWTFVENVYPSGISGTINNVWSPDWYTDGTNYYVLFQVSNQSGYNTGAPGIGYVEVTNAPAWQSGTNPAFGAYTNMNLPVGLNGPYGPILIGSTYYLFLDSGNGTNLYATSNSPLSGYSTPSAVAPLINVDAGVPTETTTATCSANSSTVTLAGVSSLTSGYQYYIVDTTGAIPYGACFNYTSGSTVTLLNGATTTGALSGGSVSIRWNRGLESSQPIQVASNLWRFYFARQYDGTIWYTESSTFPSSTWTTARQNGGLPIHAGCPLGLYGYSDIVNAMTATIGYYNTSANITTTGSASMIGGVSTGNDSTGPYGGIITDQAVPDSNNEMFPAIYNNDGADGTLQAISFQQNYSSRLEMGMYKGSDTFLLYDRAHGQSLVTITPVSNASTMVFNGAFTANGSLATSGPVSVTSSANCVSTGSGTAQLGANCPATNTAAPYRWIKMKTDDGSTVYVPAWK